MPESLQSFGDRIKTKYPDYKDMDSVELANKMLVKYPEYKDQVEVAPVKEEAPKESMFTPLGETAALTGAGMMLGKIGAKMAIPAMGLVGGGLELAKMGKEAITSSPNAPKTVMESLGRLSQGAFRGASGELLGQGLVKAAGTIGRGISEGAETLPSRMINSLIKPKTAAFTYGKNPGKAVVDEGIVATSFDDLSKQISTRKKEIGEMYKPILEQNKHITLELSDSLKPIDDAIEQVSNYPETNATVLERLNGVRKDLIQNIVKRDKTGSWGLDPQSAIDFKREIGGITKFTGNVSDDAIVNKALKGVYHNIDSKMDEAIPGIQGINERYANLLGADIAVKNRAVLMEKQNLYHIPELMTAGAVGVGSASLPVGIGAGLLYKAAGTVPGKTAMAQAVRGASNLSEPVSKVVNPLIKTGIRFGSQAIAGGVYPSSTEELMRRHYERQK